MAGRIYVVEDATSASLVRAVSAAKALTFVVKEQYKVRIANADDVASLMELGAKVEDATSAEEAPEPPEA